MWKWSWGALTQVFAWRLSYSPIWYFLIYIIFQLSESMICPRTKKPSWNVVITHSLNQCHTQLTKSPSRRWRWTSELQRIYIALLRSWVGSIIGTQDLWWIQLLYSDRKHFIGELTACNLLGCCCCWLRCYYYRHHHHYLLVHKMSTMVMQRTVNKWWQVHKCIVNSQL